MRKLLLAALLALALPATALAKNFSIGDATPFASVTVPDNWDPEEVDNGVTANSPDGTYVSLEAVALGDLEKSITENLKYLAGEGVSINDSSLEKGDGEIGGIKFVFRKWTGTDKDGPTLVTLAIAVLDEERTVVMTTWSAPETDKSDGPALEAIAGSIKPVKK